MLTAVVLDLDGLMLDTERLARRCWEQAQDDLGLPLPQGYYTGLIGRNRQQIEGMLAELFEAPEDGPRLLRRSLELYEAALEVEPLPHRPGLKTLLSGLESAGLAIAVATSSQRVHAEVKLQRSGLRARIPVLVSGDAVPASKPDPAIYRLALAELGAAPAQAVALEDSPNGVLSATGAGLRTILVPDLAPIPAEVAARAWRVVEDLTAAWAQIEVLLSRDSGGSCAR